MEYRKLGRTGLEASVIGLGCEHLVDHSLGEMEPIIQTAIDGGINIFDIFMPQPEVRTNLGKAIGRRRQDVLLQGHIGAVMIGDQPGQNRHIKVAQPFFEDFMKRLGTDYVDIGYLHFIDTEEHYQEIFDSATIEYALKLKRAGVIRAIGLSSHSAEVSLKAIKTGLVDVLMFPINPGFDLMPKDQNVWDFFDKDKQNTEKWYAMELSRQELYTTCAELGVGIVAMKPLGAGILLNSDLSPFGQALTVDQCLQYVLEKPAVSTAMVGCRTTAEVRRMLQYLDKPAQEKDYLPVLTNAPIGKTEGRCMYCNHCLPCPASIDIAAVMRLLDLAATGHNSQAVAAQYRALSAQAEDCTQCGICQARCPFGVPVIERFGRAGELI